MLELFKNTTQSSKKGFGSLLGPKGSETETESEDEDDQTPTHSDAIIEIQRLVDFVREFPCPNCSSKSI